MAVDNKLVILADEVYQSNIWKEGASFSSFKKVGFRLIPLKGWDFSARAVVKLSELYDSMC